jgi:hypothetical protein
MKAEKEFDAVRLMRELRDEINREVEPMTPEERLAYIRQRADRVRKELSLPQAVAPAIPHAQTH